MFVRCILRVHCSAEVAIVYVSATCPAPGSPPANAGTRQTDPLQLLGLNLERDAIIGGQLDFIFEKKQMHRQGGPIGGPLKAFLVDMRGACLGVGHARRHGKKRVKAPRCMYNEAGHERMWEDVD